MTWNGDTAWADVAREAGIESDNAFLQAERLERKYKQWQSLRNGRTNMEIAIAWGRTVASGTAQSGTTTTIRLAAGDTALDDFYNGLTVRCTEGTGAGQEAAITDYDEGTKDVTVASWPTATPDSTTKYVIGGADVAELDALYAGMKAMRDILFNVDVSQSDYAFSLRKFSR